MLDLQLLLVIITIIKLNYYNSDNCFKIKYFWIRLNFKGIEHLGTLNVIEVPYLFYGVDYVYRLGIGGNFVIFYIYNYININNITIMIIIILVWE